MCVRKQFHGAAGLDQNRKHASIELGSPAGTELVCKHACGDHSATRSSLDGSSGNCKLCV